MEAGFRAIISTGTNFSLALSSFARGEGHAPSTGGTGGVAGLGVLRLVAGFFMQCVPFALRLLAFLWL